MCTSWKVSVEICNKFEDQWTWIHYLPTCKLCIWLRFPNEQHSNSVASNKSSDLTETAFSMSTIKEEDYECSIPFATT
uniref:Uncharacterized protein n=1 Tax=Lepeophtheirus salmonis TaxID=72036 RepID=A0A0K2TEA7_LEPSM